MTFAMAGMLKEQTSATKAKVPLLGDIPVLGLLFRYVKHQREETELVIFVTPELVLFVDAEDEGTQPVHYAQAASPPAPLSFITTKIGTGEIILWGARLNDVAQLVPVSMRLQNAYTDNTANAAAQNIGANIIGSGIPADFVISIDPVNPSLANWGAIMDMIARW